jgi:hypothetical protein
MINFFNIIVYNNMKSSFVADSRVIPRSLQLTPRPILGRGLLDNEAEAMKNVLAMRKIVRKMPISRR